ncbi:MAG: glutamine synthetase, partial [Varibaculum cambriense]|nr:glutamine synthetase [Varibaculum cambriense]
MFNSHEEALKFVADQDIELIDIRFCDLIGTSQHFTIPADQFADALENGLMFDGSSIRGFTSIDKSDMKLIAD